MVDRKNTDKVYKYEVGTKHFNNDNLEFEVIEYISYTTRKVRFVISGYVKNTPTTSIGNGSVLDNSTHTIKYSVGREFFTNEGYKIKIIERTDSKKVKVMFLDDYNGVVEVNPIAIASGRIKNPYHKSVYGVGYKGIGVYRESTHLKISSVWRNIIFRCKSKKDGLYPTYSNITVCEEWLNFQNFAKWYEDNYPCKIEGIKFELDKDLLQQGVENKIYSQDTCIFIPHNVNSFLANKKSNNTSGITGVHWDKFFKKWVSSIRNFNNNESIKMYFDDKESAGISYTNLRVIQAEKVKLYLSDLNYLPKNIIQLIK